MQFATQFLVVTMLGSLASGAAGSELPSEAGVAFFVSIKAACTKAKPELAAHYEEAVRRMFAGAKSQVQAAQASALYADNLRYFEKTVAELKPERLTELCSGLLASLDAPLQ